MSYARTTLGDKCKHRNTSISLADGSDSHKRNGCTRIDNSDSYYLTLGRCRYSYCPLANKDLHFEKLMRLEGWTLVGKVLWGKVYNDPRNRKDGTLISTSRLESPLNTLNEGQVVNTRNSQYLLGKPNGEVSSCTQEL